VYGCVGSCLQTVVAELRQLDVKQLRLRAGDLGTSPAEIERGKYIHNLVIYKYTLRAFGIDWFWSVVSLSYVA